jgi:putative FmdB family regulatory protein
MQQPSARQPRRPTTVAMRVRSMRRRPRIRRAGRPGAQTVRSRRSPPRSGCPIRRLLSTPRGFSAGEAVRHAGLIGPASVVAFALRSAFDTLLWLMRPTRSQLGRRGWLAGMTASAYPGCVPIYDFECRACGERFEALVAAAQRPACPVCASPEPARLFSQISGAAQDWIARLGRAALRQRAALAR